MFSGSCSLKYYKRDNYYKNSTGSCEFYPETKTGYSYAEKIIKTIKDDKGQAFKVFNDYKFSNTTTNHQSALRDFYVDICMQGFTVNVSSLNNIDTLADLKTYILKDSFNSDSKWQKENQFNTNIEFLKMYASKKEIEQYTLSYQNEVIEDKASESLDRKLKKLRQLGYSSKNIVSKAYEIDSLLSYGRDIKSNYSFGSPWADTEQNKRLLQKIPTIINSKMILLIKAHKKRPFKNLVPPNMICYDGKNLEIYQAIVKHWAKYFEITANNSELLKEVESYNKLNKIFTA